MIPFVAFLLLIWMPYGQKCVSYSFVEGSKNLYNVFRIWEKNKKSIDGRNAPVVLSSPLTNQQGNPMPHQLSPKVKQIVVKLTQEHYRQLEKEAAERKMTITQYIRWVLAEETLDTKLTREDYEIIKARIKSAALRLDAKKP